MVCQFIYGYTLWLLVKSIVSHQVRVWRYLASFFAKVLDRVQSQNDCNLIYLLIISKQTFLENTRYNDYIRPTFQ